MLTSYKSQFAALLAPYFQVTEWELLSLIQQTPDNVTGDLAFPCFQFAKVKGKAPNLIASEVVASLQSKDQFFPIFSSVHAV